MSEDHSSNPQRICTPTPPSTGQSASPAIQTLPTDPGATDLRIFFKPYVDWLQKTSLGSADRRLLKTTRGHLKSKIPCAVLTDVGQNGGSYSSPCKIFAKVTLVGDSRFSFELANCYTCDHIIAEVDADPSTFPFAKRNLATAFDGVPGAIVKHEKIEPGMILQLRSTRFTIIPEKPDDESTNDDADDVDRDGHGDDDDTPMRDAHRNRTKKQPTRRVEEAPEFLELQKQVTQLQSEVRSVNAQLILEKVQNTLIKAKLQPTGPSKAFNINDYTLRKSITKSFNGRLYGVEHTSGKCHVLQEVILLEGDSANDRKNLTVANELALIEELRNTSSPENVLRVQDVFIETTPLRKSYYFLSDAVAFSLEEFANTNLHSCDDMVPYIIGAQILYGLIFIANQTSRIHGNLSCGTVLIDFNGVVKLSGFDLAFHLGEVVEPALFLSDSSSMGYKHTYLIEARDKGESIPVWPALDIFSVGCIMFRLLNDIDLFMGPPTLQTRIDMMSRAYEGELQWCVGGLFLDCKKDVTLDDVLSKDVFVGLHKESIMDHFRE